MKPDYYRGFRITELPGGRGGVEVRPYTGGTRLTIKPGPMDAKAWIDKKIEQGRITEPKPPENLFVNDGSVLTQPRRRRPVLATEGKATVGAISHPAACF